MTIQEMKDLALHAARRTAPTNFSVENVDDALRDAMASLAGSVNQFMKNRYDIYEIISETADHVVPQNVIGIMGSFAEVKTVGEGQKVMFHTQTLGKMRARKFLTQVGLSGVYESFRLDRDTFEISTKAIGGAASIDFQRFLDNEENMADVMDVITQGMTDAVFGEVQKALKASLNVAGRPAANVVISSKFEPDKMFKLCTVAKAYGGGNATIFAAPEFVGAMGADAIVPVSGNIAGVYHPDDIDAIHRTGYVNLFRGTPIVQLPQSFVDENTNETTQIDPQLAYVLPSGREKVVKIVMEGPTQIKDFSNRDNSMEINTWKKIGVGILSYYDWCIYQNTGITQTLEDTYELNLV